MRAKVHGYDIAARGHCKDCQRFSGAALSTSMIVRDEDFEVLSGQTVRYDRKADLRAGAMHRIAAEHASRCPLWVKSRHRSTPAQCPLYPQKRTLLITTDMSALCQKHTFDGRSY
jgi:hypothetical protein